MNRPTFSAVAEDCLDEVYRYLLMLAARDNGSEIELIDLGPSRVDAKIGSRVLEFLRADR